MGFSSKRLKWILSIFIFIFIATFLFFGVKSYMIKRFMANFKQPPVTVSAEKAVLKTWHPYLSSAGTLYASKGVEVNSQVDGQITQIYFKSGMHVNQGALLLQLDDSVDQQALNKDEAQLRYNKVDYDRKRTLLRQSAVSQSARDAAKAAYLESLAAVESDKVAIAHKKIIAPFSGKIGIRQVNLGQYITPSTKIVTLQALDPLFADFSLPEQDLPKLFVGQPVTVAVSAYPKELFHGKLIAINSAVDINTRSIMVRASLPNPNEKLYPGLFANVHVILPVKNNVVTVPQSAIAYSMYGDSVYVVEPKGKTKIAVQKYVLVGDRRGNVVSITKGVKAGDEVVTAGQLKLHPNATVVINNSVNLN